MATVMHRYYDALADLAARLVSLMARGLGMDPATFEPSIDQHTSALRLLHYPHVDPTTAEPGQLRAGAHSDYGTLTLLRQDDAPGGLEVLGLDNTWHPVPATDGAYVVNIGDALERWTNGRWRSTLHRVQLPPTDGAGNERFSIAFFHNANWDAQIDCLEACRPGDGSPVLAPIPAGQHLMERFRSTQDAHT
jgi:isopenicillin N synthase-like dioxygenase